MVTQLNSCLAKDDWHGVDLSIDNIFYSEDSKNETLMENVISKIVIPQKHWKTLEKGHSMHSLLLLRVISMFLFRANKESIETCVYQCEGLVSLHKCFVSKGLPDSEQMFCLLTLTIFLQKTEFCPKNAELIVPVAKTFKNMMLKKNVSFLVMQQGVKLIRIMSLCQNKDHLLSEIFESGYISYAVKVLSRCQKLKHRTSLERILNVYHSLCWSISECLSVTSIPFDKQSLPILIMNTIKVIRTVVIYEGNDVALKINILEACVLNLFDLMNMTAADSMEDLKALEKYKVVDEVVFLLENIFQNEDFIDIKLSLICNCYMIIDCMMDCLQNVKSIAPLLSLVHKSLASKSAFRSTSSHSGFVASFCYKAIKRGDKEDLQRLISQGLIPLLARLQNNFTCVSSTFELINALYNLILSVPEKVDLSCFNKELYDSLLYQYWNPCSCCENGKTHSEEKLEQAYVIVALGISCNCTEEKKFISLNDYFYNEFQEFQTKVDFIKSHPSSFLLKNMAKVNCFKSSVLPYIWFLANVGSNKIVQDLHHSLPKSDGQNKRVLSKR